MDNNNFVDKINKELQKTNMSISTFAKKIKLTRQGVYSILNGAKPQSETVVNIANCFGVTIDYLLGREEKPPIEHLSVSHIAKKFNEWGLSVDKLNSLTKDQQVIILNVVKNLVNEFADGNKKGE